MHHKKPNLDMGFRRVCVLLVLITMVMTTSIPSIQGQNENWAKRVNTGKEVITTLEFYFQDILGGRNGSSVTIVPSPVQNSSTVFGALIMADDPLTVGPDLNSKIIGRAKGMYGSASQTAFELIMLMSFVFTEGIYNGSSFSLVSNNPTAILGREMSIVGGTGLFRMGRGYAIASTYYYNATTGYARVGYNVTLLTNI